MTREKLLGRETGTIIVNGEPMLYWLPVGVPPLDSWGALPYTPQPKPDGLEELIGKVPATDAQASARNPPVGRTEEDESNAADEIPF